MPQSFALTCHDSTPTNAVEAIAVRVHRTPAALALTFCVDGQLDRLRIPVPETPRMAALLWQHTCFEAFVSSDGTSAYHELNLSPSGAWTVHAFRAYRDGGPLADSRLAPATQVRRTPNRLELDAHMHLDRLSPAYAQATLRLGLAAVMELDDGALTYWSLQHAPGKPDFHHPSGFALRLEPATATW